MTFPIVTDADAVADLIAQASLAGCDHLIPLLRDVRDARISAISPQRDTRMPPLWRIGKAGRPIVVVVGDDDHATTGPEGWACAAKLRSWASAAIVHGAAGEAAHYALASAFAALYGRVLFVETDSANTDAWGMFLNERAGLPIMGILADGVHPTAPGRGEMH